MESQPQNPEFRINPGNFHPCTMSVNPFCTNGFSLMLDTINLGWSIVYTNGLQV